jgi:hypothetical protein
LIEPQFGAIGFDSDKSMAKKAKIALGCFQAKTICNSSRLTLFQKVIRVIQREEINALVLKAIKHFQR